MLNKIDVENLYRNKIGGVYQILNKVNGKMYIGSTYYFYSRYKSHYNSLISQSHCNKYLQNSWNKYGEENFEFNIIEEVLQEDLLIQREQYWIDYYNSSNKLFGYNILPNAGRTFGVKRSDETKQKLREAKLGDRNPMYKKQVSEETRNKLSFSILNMDEEIKKESYKKRGKNISKSLIGRKLSDETKLKIRNKHVGVKLPEEQKSKIKDSLSIKVVQTNKDGSFVKLWNSMIDIQRELSYDCGAISRCCRKINKTYKNCLWFFANEYYSEDFDITTYVSRKRRKNIYEGKVSQIDPITHELIRVWDSIDEAVEFFNTERRYILNCCNHKRCKTACGYIWEWLNIEVIKEAI